MPPSGSCFCWVLSGRLSTRGRRTACGEFRVQNLPLSGRAFVLGLLLLGLSVVIDQTTHGHYLWEDAPKLLGALVWLTVPLLELPSNVLSASRVSRGRPPR